MIVETWKDIVGYEGRYQVSDQGRVKSLPRLETRSDGRIFQHPEGLLKSSVAKKSGHSRVNLRKDGKSKTCWVHQLVAVAFLGPKPDEHEVCHRDGAPSNNVETNLRWGTRTSNIKDRRTHGDLVRGEDVVTAKLKEGQVLQIRHRLLVGEKAIALAAEFDVSPATISNIKTRSSWVHV